MTPDNDTKQHQALFWRDGKYQSGSLELIGEEPLSIRIEGSPYAVVMRTPGEELFHAAGFCLGEGLVETPDQFLNIGYCQDLDPNVIEIRLSPEQRTKVADLLDRRGFVSQTSCGICGKEMLKDLQQVLSPVDNGLTLEAEGIFRCLDKLFETQNYYPRTKGSHAALILDHNLNRMAFSEDVGRHNALDKAVGKVFMNRQLEKAGPLVLSSRISYELVQKAARANLQIMISKSRPTALAVELGRALNITLAFASDKTELFVVSGEHRILNPGSCLVKHQA
ncbi:MAG: formate dehydrogenase accessory sulfurtransferase FdhD [Thermodesulfobacteriota bacterium]